MTYKFGGPAGLFRDKNHPLCWSLLDYCARHKQKCPIKFLSFHRKGNGSAQGVINGTEVLLNKIFGSYPNLRMIPIANE